MNRSRSTGPRMNRGDAASVMTSATKIDPGDVLLLGRNTLSARTGLKHQRGINAILASFPKQKQLAVREHCRDYLEVCGRIEVMNRRVAEDDGSDLGDPEILRTLRDHKKEIEFQLKKHAGPASDAMFAALKDPDLQDAFRLQVESEEDAVLQQGGDQSEDERRRRWLRGIDTRRVARTGGRSFAATHNHVTNRGRKSIWNQQVDDSDNLSYYQRAQQKYGRSNSGRGPASIAGAWEGVFGAEADDTGSVMVGRQTQAPRPDRPMAASAMIPEEPSRAAADAAAAAVAQLSNGDVRYRHPSESDEPAPATARGNRDLYTSLMNQSAALLHEVQNRGPIPQRGSARGRNGGPEPAARPPPPVPAAQRPAPVAATPPSVERVASASSAAFGQSSQLGSARQPMKSFSGLTHLSSFHGSSASMGMPADAAAFQRRPSAATGLTTTTKWKGDGESVLPLPRHTLSANSAKKHYRGVHAVLASFNKKLQYAIREQLIDLLELQQRWDAMSERLATNNNDLQFAEGEEPEVLKQIRLEIDDRKRNLKRLSGEAAYESLLTLLQDPESYALLGVEIDREEDQATEQEQRLWRRRMDLKKHSRRVGVDGVRHDNMTRTGQKDFWNEMNYTQENKDEELSYYQRLSKYYGRGRRGSTAVSGAWELLFDDEGNMIEGDAEGAVAAPNSAMLDSMVVPPSEALDVGQLNSELEHALTLAQDGDADELCSLAVELARQAGLLQLEQEQIVRGGNRPVPESPEQQPATGGRGIPPSFISPVAKHGSGYR